MTGKLLEKVLKIILNIGYGRKEAQNRKIKGQNSEKG
jgi:hypothetical protein